MDKILNVAAKVPGVDKVVNELKPVVQQIEASPKTCKGYYDRYMIILSKFPNRQKEMAAILIMAGANRYGVESALSLLNL